MDLKKKVLIEFTIFIVLIILSVMVYLHGRDLSCDKCKVSFFQDRMLGRQLEEPIKFSVNVTDLYNSIKDGGECLVSWDNQNGYHYFRKI